MLQAHLSGYSTILMLIDGPTDGRTGLCGLIAACLLQGLACTVSAALTDTLPKGRLAPYWEARNLL